MSATVIALNATIKTRLFAPNGLRQTQSCVTYSFMDAKAKREAERDPRDVAIGAVVRARREALGLSMAEFAERALKGKSPGQVSRFETGENGFSWRQLCDIADFFGTTVGQLEAEARILRESIYYDAQKRLLELPRDAVDALLTILMPRSGT